MKRGIAAGGETRCSPDRSSVHVADYTLRDFPRCRGLHRAGRPKGLDFDMAVSKGRGVLGSRSGGIGSRASEPHVARARGTLSDATARVTSRSSQPP